MLRLPIEAQPELPTGQQPELRRQIVQQQGLLHLIDLHQEVQRQIVHRFHHPQVSHGVRLLHVHHHQTTHQDQELVLHQHPCQIIHPDQGLWDLPVQWEVAVVAEEDKKFVILYVLS